MNIISTMLSAASLPASSWYGKLSNLQMELEDAFFRCHRAYLVHLKYVLRYTAIDIELENGLKILMAKQKYNEFLKAYLNYMKRVNEDDI